MPSIKDYVPKHTKKSKGDRPWSDLDTFVDPELTKEYGRAKKSAKTIEKEKEDQVKSVQLVENNDVRFVLMGMSKKMMGLLSFLHTDCLKNENRQSSPLTSQKIADSLEVKKTFVVQSMVKLKEMNFVKGVFSKRGPNGFFVVTLDDKLFNHELIKQ